jgi:hypothetical protein
MHVSGQLYDLIALFLEDTLEVGFGLQLYYAFVVN